MTTPRRFLPTPARRSADSPPHGRFHSRTESNAADPQFARAPKFFISDRRGDRFKHNKGHFNAASDASHGQTEDKIQDISSAETSFKQAETDDPILGARSDEEMLFDTFVEHSPTNQSSSSPLRKRQKVDPSNANKPESFDLNSTRTSPAQKPLASAHRYIIPSTRPVEKVSTPLRPSFLTPAPTVESLEAHLPQIFSPDRKSHKFLSSGLASSMRSHIIEAGSVHGNSSSKGFANIKIQIVQLHKLSSVSLARGQTQASEINLLLVGGASTPKPGDIIQIKGVNWSIELKGSTWVVVVGWKFDS
jgi:hypothetical protein